MRIDESSDVRRQAELQRQLEQQHTQDTQDAGRDTEARLDATKQDDRNVQGSDTPQAAELRTDAQPMEQELSGVEKADAAVETANQQQDSGESWQDYSGGREPTTLPPDVEALAQEERDKERAAEEGKVSVRDLQNEMAVQQRMLRG